MARMFERRCGRVGLALTAVTLFVASRAVAAGAIAMSGGPEAVALASPRHAPSPEVPFHTTSARAILARYGAAEGAPREGTAAPFADLAAAPACDGLRVSVIASSADPDWSMAALVADDAAGGVLRRRGGGVGDRLVEYVGTDRVWLSKQGELCQARLFDGARASRKPPTPRPQPTPPVRLAADPRVAAGIVRKGPGAFDVDRGVIERLRQDPSQLMSFGQLVPEHNASGTTLGMRLGALQPGTLPTLLGLESGDRLEAINGYSVSDPEKLLELYARLSSASRVVIDVVRGGHAQSIEYSIR